VIATADFETWRARFDEADFIWAPVKEVADVLEDPTVAMIGAFTDVADSNIGPYRTLNTPFRIQGADIGVRGPAPAPGEHTMEVLRERGVSEDQIAMLAARGAFG
jgi:crotonobetainyl-CoA:carnitine CoA-transferase CaiB-like acyl-CoA transferase